MAVQSKKLGRKNHSLGFGSTKEPFWHLAHQMHETGVGQSMLQEMSGDCQAATSSVRPTNSSETGLLVKWGNPQIVPYIIVAMEACKAELENRNVTSALMFSSGKSAEEEKCVAEEIVPRLAYIGQKCKVEAKTKGCKIKTGLCVVHWLIECLVLWKEVLLIQVMVRWMIILNKADRNQQRDTAPTKLKEVVIQTPTPIAGGRVDST